MTPVSVALKLSLMMMTMFLGFSNALVWLNLRIVGTIEATDVSFSERMKSTLWSISDNTFCSSKGNMSLWFLRITLYDLASV